MTFNSPPWGSIMEMMRSRRMQIAQMKAQREAEKKAQIGQFIQLGLMGVGAALGAGIAGPAIGGALGGTTAGTGGAAATGSTMGGILGGAGLGQAAGGLLGGAATGTLTPMGAVSGGLGLAGSIYGMGQQGAERGVRDQLYAANAGYAPIEAGVDANLEQGVEIGGQTWAPGLSAGDENTNWSYKDGTWSATVKGTLDDEKRQRIEALAGSSDPKFKDDQPGIEELKDAGERNWFGRTGDNLGITKLLGTYPEEVANEGTKAITPEKPGWYEFSDGTKKYWDGKKWRE